MTARELAVSELAMAAADSAPAGKGGNKRARAWLLAFVGPMIVGPIWVESWSRWTPVAFSFFCTLTGLIVLLLAAVTSVMDIRWHKIPNWATYPAIAWGLVINTSATLIGDETYTRLTGAEGLASSLLGASVLFVLMFSLFSVTGGGAGDVKLATSLGALLGLSQAIDALALGFVVAGAGLVSWCILRHGASVACGALGRMVGSVLLPIWIGRPTPQQRALLLAPIPLAPFFSVGVLFVLFDFRIDQWLP